ncbi:uncharacterized protein LOC142348663 isoform X2 [Convolutriloba macropyga]
MGPEWRTLRYVLPQKEIQEGPSFYCSFLSRRFCFMGNFITHKQRERAADDTDYIEFVHMLMPFFRDINWFTLSKPDTLNGELCCEKQFSIYKQFGQKNGMTPYEYLDVVMNFTDHNRKLNYIKGHFDRHLSTNVIIELGFGTGPLKKSGLNQNCSMYMLTPNRSGDLYYFIGNQIDHFLSFDWFKNNIMCDEHWWICERYPPQNLVT